MEMFGKAKGRKEKFAKWFMIILRKPGGTKWEFYKIVLKFLAQAKAWPCVHVHVNIYGSHYYMDETYEASQVVIFVN